MTQTQLEEIFNSVMLSWTSLALILYIIIGILMFNIHASNYKRFKR